MTRPLIKPVLILQPGLGPSKDRHTPPQPRGPLVFFHFSLLGSPAGGRDRHEFCHLSSIATAATPEDPPPRLGSLSRGCFLQEPGGALGTFVSQALGGVEKDLCPFSQ